MDQPIDYSLSYGFYAGFCTLFGFGVLMWLAGIGTYRIYRAMFPKHPECELTDEECDFEQWTREVRSWRVRRITKLVAQNQISEEE